MRNPMRAALVVNPVTHDCNKNLTNVVQMIHEAAVNGSNLVLLGEMAVTGMVNNDDPLHDLPLGETIPGPLIDRLSVTASKLGIHLGFGLLELDDGVLYDTALLLSPTGDILLKYRRIQPQWHGVRANPAIYCQGTDLQNTETEFGSVIFLICGDLYDQTLIHQARDMRPDWVFHPHARSFDDHSRNQGKWEKENLPDYQFIQIIGFILLIPSYYLLVRATIDNPYLSTVVRIQSDRKQQFISTGLYGVIRHPQYLGIVTLIISGPLILGSIIGLIIGICIVAIILVRIDGEEKMLIEELEGYDEYRQRVKYRLLPLIW
jgi:protein-S-isoprenylcysteine O-methyltransferase Ste14